MPEQQSEKVRQFFNQEYDKIARYWWQGANRYDPDPSKHTAMNAALLVLANEMRSGAVLDMGAGEGADSIRLARMGFTVTAIELSDSGVDKINRFANEAGVSIDVIRSDVANYRYVSDFDIILCQGVLQYIEDKTALLEQMKAHTNPGGINAISCFSDWTPTPECHMRVPIFPDAENGCIMKAYEEWPKEYLTFDRDVLEHSHSGMPLHSHSFIKLIARKPLG